jgi:hypothetical protein
MMPFDSEAPDALRGRVAEDREIILLGVTPFAAIVLDDPEDIFEAHDRRGFDVALLT